MGVYACLLISLLLILQTVWISSLSNASNNSFPYESLSNPPLQTHHLHQQPRLVKGGGGKEENNKTAAESWTVSKAKGGGRSGAGGAGANNHRPGKAKNAASTLMNSNNNIIIITTLLLLLLFPSFISPIQIFSTNFSNFPFQNLQLIHLILRPFSSIFQSQG